MWPCQKDYDKTTHGLFNYEYSRRISGPGYRSSILEVILDPGDRPGPF